MKALGMDASLQERKELAKELGFTGDANDSAKMNTFLHKTLMKRLSENGEKCLPILLTRQSNCCGTVELDSGSSRSAESLTALVLAKAVRTRRGSW